jgi:hypothetical protein
MLLTMPIAEWQHLVIAQNILLGMQPIIHMVHCIPMSPLEITSALHPFPFTTPPKHVLQCWPIL